MAKRVGSDIEPRIPATVPAAHARALSAHFKTVEEYLRVVESSLEGFEGVFYGLPSEVPPAQQARIRSLSAEILDGLRVVKHDLGLRPFESSSLGVIRAYLSELWVSLVETRGRHLRGYGEVPADLAAYLDRRVGELESRVNEIRAIVEEVARGRAGKTGVPRRREVKWMALDELHAGRLAAVIGVFEDALDRIELLLEGVEQGGRARGVPQPEPDELRNLHLTADRMRRRLQAAAERFEVRSTRPYWRQQLAAELSTLWVVLENAMPRRMKGYGREFAAQDRADWEALIRDLLHEIERMRPGVTPRDSP